MNKKTLLIILGIGVLLYLWNKGYFKSKKTPIGVAEPPADQPLVEEPPKFMDESAPMSISQTSPINQSQAPLDDGIVQVAETTVFDETAGEDMLAAPVERVGASGYRSFGFVRRPR